MKTAPSKTPTFYIFPPFLPKPPPQRWRPSRHKHRYICFMCQWISAVCPPMMRCLTTHIFSPSTYILYIRCNSLPPRVRPVGVGVLPPHAKALDIGYKGLWLGREDESCRFGTCLRSSGGHLPAFLTNSFCPICVIKRWLIIKRIAILLHKHRGSVHANVVFIRKNLPE